MIDPALSALQQVVDRLRRERFAAAYCVLWCGSIVRGEGTATSDLDLVVLFAHVEAAWRESFHYEGWPVECFCLFPKKGATSRRRSTTSRRSIGRLPRAGSRTWCSTASRCPARPRCLAG